MGILQGITVGLMKADTRSLDFSSNMTGTCNPNRTILGAMRG